MSRMFHNIVKLDAMSSSNKPSIALCKTSRPRWPPWPRHEPWTWALKTEIQSNLSPPLWMSKYQILFHFDHIKTFQCWRGNIYRLYSCDNLLRLGSIDQAADAACDNLENADWSVIARRSYSLFISTKPSCNGDRGKTYVGNKQSNLRTFLSTTLSKPKNSPCFF